MIERETRRYEVESIEHPDHPDFKRAYQMLWEGFGPAGEMEPEDVMQQMLDSAVRGRGGAGFAMGKKMSFIPRGTMDKYLVCNADES